MNRAVVPTRPEETSTILLRWLVGLRWVLFFLLAITLPIGERLFGFKVLYEVALPAILVVVGLNAAMQRRLKKDPTGAAAGVSSDDPSAAPRPSAREGSSPGAAAKPPVSVPAIALGVALDLVAIGVVLAAAGGAANPFSALFFVHVALAAPLLPAAPTTYQSPPRPPRARGIASPLFASGYAATTTAYLDEDPETGGGSVLMSASGSVLVSGEAPPHVTAAVPRHLPRLRPP